MNRNDRVRIKKMVDGCINAIADDVKKEVTQKLIDESKHVKLIAEKDTNTSRNRQSRVQQQKTTKNHVACIGADLKILRSTCKRWG